MLRILRFVLSLAGLVLVWALVVVLLHPQKLPSPSQVSHRPPGTLNEKDPAV